MSHHLYLIRHGKTQGNLDGRYSGSANEPLHQNGRDLLLEKKQKGYYPEVQRVYISPMRRCRETAELLYPGMTPIPIPGFAEYSFGEFEGKTYQELKDNPAYRKWVESGGSMEASGGESMEDFKVRCCMAFQEVVEEVLRDSIEHTSLIVHGGTIMSILEKYGQGERDFYRWQIANGDGYQLLLAEALWAREKRIQSCNPLPVWKK